MEFIENNEKYGIKYDLSKIAKEYKKLKIPRQVKKKLNSFQKHFIEQYLMHWRAFTKIWVDKWFPKRIWIYQK